MLGCPTSPWSLQITPVRALPDVYAVSAPLRAADGQPIELWLRNDKGFAVGGETVTLSIRALGYQSTSSVIHCFHRIHEFPSYSAYDGINADVYRTLANDRWDDACRLDVSGSMKAVADDRGHVIFRDLAVRSAVPGTYKAGLHRGTDHVHAHDHGVHGGGQHRRTVLSRPAGLRDPAWRGPAVADQRQNEGTGRICHVGKSTQQCVHSGHTCFTRRNHDRFPTNMRGDGTVFATLCHVT